MAVVARDSSGRATRIELRGAAIRRLSGESFRAVLNRSFGDRAVQSTRFTVERRGSSYVISGSGFGHGVGLCQVGAAARLRRGDPVDVVLAAYFPGASVTRLRPGTLMPDTRGRGQTTASLLELR